MAFNKFKATWLSASSIGAYLNCKKAYYFSAIFKDSDGCKISTASSHLVVGNCVHNPLEMLARFPSEERKYIKLQPEFNRSWKELSPGVFKDEAEEAICKESAIDMIKRVKANIHHLEGETVFLGKETELPQMILSEKDELILCGKIDYLLRRDDGLFVIDFKTGKPVADSSLQIPIYKILCSHYYPNEKFRGAYWYIKSENDPTEAESPPLTECIDRVMEIGLQIKETRKSKVFECKNGAQGCFYCQPYEKILAGEGKYIGKNGYGVKQYVL